VIIRRLDPPVFVNVYTHYGLVGLGLPVEQRGPVELGCFCLSYSLTPHLHIYSYFRSKSLRSVQTWEHSAQTSFRDARLEAEMSCRHLPMIVVVPRERPSFDMIILQILVGIFTEYERDWFGAKVREPQVQIPILSGINFWINPPLSSGSKGLMWFEPDERNRIQW